MSYNKYNTRHSGRYNTPGQFVSAGELSAARSQNNFSNNMGPPQQLSNVQYEKPQPPSQTFKTIIPEPPPPNVPMTEDIDMKSEVMETSGAEDSPSRPPWMKARLYGVRKISNKERRRRQNENLRRLLTPKNALMVLNEIMPGEQLASQFKVEAVSGGTQFYRPNAHSFCADLTLQGQNYKGYGENKLTARNAAAEQAIRDLMLQRMTRFLTEARNNTPAAAAAAAAAANDGEESQETENEEPDESLPMIQLASYALHKLFTEWEYEGHKVPQLRPNNNNSVSETASESGSIVTASKPKVKTLPASAATMHPCMLLTYMRSNLEYRELAVEGTHPPNIFFTMAIDVDGNTYTGKASNKKEARKAAARAACEAVFNMKFDY